MDTINKIVSYTCGLLSLHHWVYQNGENAPLRRCRRCKMEQKYQRLLIYGNYMPGKWVKY
jgi:hypothetical protein